MPRKDPPYPTSLPSSIFRGPTPPPQKGGNNSNGVRDFQIPVDLPTVSLRAVNLAQRSVFERPHLIDMETYEQKYAHTKKKVSPSYNHLQMLHVLNRQQTIYQLHFSPSTSEAASLPNVPASSNNQRDGRYRSIDIQAVRDALPKPAPYISYKKHRLPNRADVGFRNPLAEDVEQKQQEIRNETQWEEHSPRLIVFCNSEQFGALDSTAEGWAGRDLLAAKQQHHSGSKHKHDPNRYSMLAPPLEALYSGSQGWRPRPIHDRPVGMRYCLCAPLSIRSPSSDASEWIGSLTLYSLPPMYKDKQHTTASAAASYHCRKNHTVPTFGKISEAFWFPNRQSHGKRAIFGYDPLDLTMESSKRDAEQDPASVYVVLQLYKQRPIVDNDNATSEQTTLTPVCFGIAKFFSKDETIFPDGKSKEIQLYQSPPHPESQTDFVERLWRVIQNRTDNNNGEQTVEDSTKKKRGGRFRSPNGRSRSPRPASRSPPPNRDHGNKNGLANKTMDNARFNAFATLFLSSLKADFVQAMLSHPSDWDEPAGKKKMLVDVSGDFAVVLDRPQVENIVAAPEIEKKRSSLVRLPPSPRPAGYCGDSNFREVLYLPARPEKHYDFDSIVGFNSVHLNLLYLYPRKLRRLDAKKGRDVSRCTLRIQVVQADDSQAAGCSPIQCLYNSTAWTGSSIVNTIYTSVSDELAPSEWESGVPMIDEWKLRLPAVLDGSHRLVFTLFSASSDATVPLTKVSEASIPLSSSTPRDGGPRVATVIPNGKHRLELGNFQLQFETRLVSSLHVGDPSVAAVLRNLTSDTGPGGGRTHSEPSGVSATPKLIEALSKTSAAGCFRVLLYMVLRDVCNPSSSHHRRNISDFTDVSRLFDLLATVKLSVGGDEPWSRLAKSCLDEFDERGISGFSKLIDTVGQDPFPDGHLGIQPLQEIMDTADDGSVRLRRRSKRQSYLERRASRVTSALNSSAAPFSRVVYGASREDRMRAEAESHYEHSQHFGPFFDDDETIATVPSLSSDKIRVENSGALRIDIGSESITNKSVFENASLAENSVVRTKSTQSKNLDDKIRSIGETDFAKRVKTAASVILAPCVAPSLSRVLRTSSPKETPFKSATSGGNLDQAYGGPMCLCAPGSDIDETESLQEENGQSSSDFMPVSLFSSLAENTVSDKHRLGFVYEAIIPTWIESWVRKDSPYDEASRDEYAASFVEHAEFLLPLCLKSLSLNFAVKLSSRASGTNSKLVPDEASARVLKAFADVLGRGLLFTSRHDASTDSNDQALFRALSMLDSAVDFLVGLSGLLELQFVRAILEAYFRALRSPELKGPVENIPWDQTSLRNVKCSRILILRSIEKLATLPAFMALNRPMKYLDSRVPNISPQLRWLSQGSPRLGNSKDEAEPLPSDSDSGWLIDLVTNECLSACALCCGVVVGEAVAHMENSSGRQTKLSVMKKRPGAELTTDNLLMFQSIAAYAIDVFFELVVRRHAVDRRFQTESARSRVAAASSRSMLENSVKSFEWISKMDPQHKIRSLWLLSMLYTLQEAPEAAIVDFIASCCEKEDFRIAKFLRLLRFCCSTFQDFHGSRAVSVVQPHSVQVDSTWLSQEIFNTLCATTNLVVDVVVEILRGRPSERRVVVGEVLQLLLQVLALPQSSVTQLRAIGGALQVLEAGVEGFIDATGSTFQHWARVILSMMNKVALSVRSIAVDFLVSLFGGIFDLHGNIDSVTLVFATVLPEVVATEIGLYGTSGQIGTPEDVAMTVWPLRRSLADLDDSNPLDDSRVDPQLLPCLSKFCRAAQAIVDGVLVEMYLMKRQGDGDNGNSQPIFSPGLSNLPSMTGVFDSDEESLFEATEFFVPESSPMQRLRWLMTLKALHESKEKWVEAGEALFLCARTICDCIPHLKHVWRPTRFAMWPEKRDGIADSSKTTVSKFAEHFLEPQTLLGLDGKTPGPERLQQPTVSTMCNLLTKLSKESVRFYFRERGMDQLAHDRLENLQKVLMAVVDNHAQNSRRDRIPSRSSSIAVRVRQAEEEAALRRAVSSISAEMTKLADRLLRNVEGEPSSSPQSNWTRQWKPPSHPRSAFVAIRLFGKKPPRFEESTTIPTFLEWEKVCICRVPSASNHINANDDAAVERSCLDFAAPLLKALQKECGKKNVQLRTHPDAKEAAENLTYLHVIPVEILDTDPFTLTKLTSKRFFHRKGSAYVETKVAKEFPGALSRQSALLTTEFVSAKTASSR